MGPRHYGFSGSITGATAKTAISVTATSAVRPMLKRVIVSSNATPAATNSSEWQVLRFTAAGTSTAVTPVTFDSGNPAATSVCGKNHSAEPTYAGVSLLDIAHNQLATVQWRAAPDEEIVAPATAANGMGVQCQGISGSGVAEIVSVVFAE